MKTVRPELGLERLLIAIERDLLDASDEEIMAAANELGMKPGMKGSIALFGVTSTVRFRNQYSNLERQTKKASGPVRAARSRRRPKGDAPSST